MTAEVVGEVKGDKIYVFKFKRRKNYRRKTGHRAKFTEVKITGVKLRVRRSGGLTYSVEVPGPAAK